MGKLNKKIYTQKTMDFKTGMLAIVVGMVIMGFASEVCAYTYETVSVGPDRIGVHDVTQNVGQYDWSTTQWNYQGGNEWWGYRESSINGYHSYSHHTKEEGELGVCARAYNSHPEFADQPNKKCSNSAGAYAYAFAGWSSNMQEQQREVYCTSL